MEEPCSSCNTYTHYFIDKTKLSESQRLEYDMEQFRKANLLRETSLPSPDEYISDPPPTQALKHDSGKLPMSLVPPEALEGFAEVLSFGAEKYGERNWENGMEWSRLFDAALRHQKDFLKGERKDPESGYSHLKHAFANLGMLIAYEARGMNEYDNLP